MRDKARGRAAKDTGAPLVEDIDPLARIPPHRSEGFYLWVRFPPFCRSAFDVYAARWGKDTSFWNDSNFNYMVWCTFIWMKCLFDFFHLYMYLCCFSCDDCMRNEMPCCPPAQSP